MSLETSRINRKPLVAILPWNLCSHYWRLVIPIWLPSSTAFFFCNLWSKFGYTGTTLDNIVKGSIIDINFALTSDLSYNTLRRRSVYQVAHVWAATPCCHPLPGFLLFHFPARARIRGRYILVHAGTTPGPTENFSVALTDGL